MLIRTISISLLACLLLASGYWFGMRNVHQSLPALSTDTAAKQIYVCPMHSHIVQDHPGSCPICGMDLVQKGQDANNAQIYVDTATRQKFGVRLATAERSKLTHDIHTYATITADQNKTRRITPTVMGILVQLHARYSGQQIEAGEPLYEIYSEELQNLQNEYIDYVKRREQTLKAADDTRARNQKIFASVSEQNAEQAKQMSIQSEEQIESMILPMRRDGERLTARLKFAGFSEPMLKHLDKTHQAGESITVRATHTCTILDIKAREGMSVTAMTELFSCTKPGQGWLEVVFYADQTDYIHEGEIIDIAFADGSQLQTRLSGLSTVTDGTTRTLKAHIPIKLPVDAHLGDYAEVTVHSSPREVLNIPLDSVIRSGRGSFVMKALGDGHFVAQKIITGISNHERIGIIHGLEPGEQIAVNGQFLLDSAASIADTVQRYQQNQ